MTFSIRVNNDLITVIGDKMVVTQNGTLKITNSEKTVALFARGTWVYAFDRVPTLVKAEDGEA